MSLPFYLTRRHRRPLLFPPGLLALAWLLWLGCVALPQVTGKKSQEYVKHLTTFGPRFPNEPLQPIWPPYFSSLELAAFRPWQTIYFTGNLWQDYFSYQQIPLAVNHLREDTQYEKGIKIQFKSAAIYKSLVFSLDQLSNQDIKRYWLDTQHQPTNLYAINNSPIPVDTPKSTIPMMSCGTSDNMAAWRLPPASTCFADLIAPNWRSSTLLLLLMALLSAVRLGRQFLIH